ncbi:MAG: hypothetical protein R6U98_25660 [Pirellulaceae bacterium]
MNDTAFPSHERHRRSRAACNEQQAVDVIPGLCPITPSNGTNLRTIRINQFGGGATP